MLYTGQRFEEEMEEQGERRGIERSTFVRESWLSDLCTVFLVTDPGSDSWTEAVFPFPLQLSGLCITSFYEDIRYRCWISFISTCHTPAGAGEIPSR